MTTSAPITAPTVEPTRTSQTASLGESVAWLPVEGAEPTGTQSAGSVLETTILRKAFGCFPSGVAALCALDPGDEDRPAGIAASSFTSVSLDPALVSVCIAHTSTTWPRLAGLARVGVSVLAEHHEEVASALASKRADRFDGIDWAHSASGAVFVHGSTLWLECAIDRTVRAGDHDIVLLRIIHLRSNPDVAPMVFHGSSFKRLTTA
ncbi:flavin reductase family protein [Nocardioides sp. PD653]|uniref:flavin reductase family protein n=1 Tax=Nocardioides sp. PD653 TaxID=393303 RepID=UPI0009EFCDAC|nr:flavin reductase family protein [Nocardioides sp. PD653]GAW54773.1 Hexachlorobenzene oxidative dehalogenase system reductase component [Nocardioides sp. PD653]